MIIVEKLVDLENGTEEIIERSETEQEKLEREDFERRLAVIKQAETEAATKRAAALAKLATLGLTSDDLKALGL